MASPHICSECESREADLIVSLVATGDSRWLCLPCAPFAVAGLFPLSGLPEIVIVTADDARAAGIELVDSDAGPGEAVPGPEDGEPGDGDTDDLEPEFHGPAEGPGVLEQIEQAEGRVTPARGPSRSRKSETSESSGNGAATETVAPATHD